MDSVKEEVLKEVSSAMAEMGDFHNDIPAVLEVAEKHTDAIMSAFKRGAGVVDAGEAELIAAALECYAGECGDDVHDKCLALANRITSAVEPAPVPQGGDRQAALALNLSARCCPDQFTRYHPTVGAVADAIEEAEGDEVTMAQAAIRAFIASGEISEIVNPDRENALETPLEEISALEPSCVVTDEMVEAACAALQADVAKRHPEAQGGWPGRIPDKDLAIARNGMRLALTAALSSRTEEEVRADEVNEAIAALVASARKCDATWKSGKPLGRWKDLREALSMYDQATSANPPRGERSVIEAAIHKLALEADRSELTIDRGQDAIGRPVRTKLSDWLRSPTRSLTNGGE